MRALYLEGHSVKFRQSYPDPVPGDGEVLIQVKMAGVCQTDYELARGYMGFQGILGHEFVGIVTKLGKGVDPQWTSRRVCAEINCVCGKCEMCARGLSTHCFHRSVLGILNHDGAFADFIRVPAANLHAVPDNVTDEQAVFVEPLAAALQILRQVPIEKRTKVTVLGDGRLGQLVAQVVARTGCTLILVGRHLEKLALADRLGIHTVIDQELIVRRDQDIVIDCTGRPEGLERAVALVRPRGTVILKTTVEKARPMNLAQVVIDEVTVLGSRCGPFAEAIGALARREVDVLPLVSRRIKLEQLDTLFGVGKAEGFKTIVMF